MLRLLSNLHLDALAASSKEIGTLRSVVLKQQAEMRSLRDELFDQNMQMMDQLTKLAGMEHEDVAFQAWCLYCS